MTISGKATNSETENYKEQFPDKSANSFFRQLSDRWISSIGLGTYLGDASDQVDDNYRTSVCTALKNGINLIDTAANYRFQRSERVVGEALDRVFQETDLEREQIVVATKAGFVPYDTNRPDDPLEYIQSSYIEPGVAEEDDFTNSGHCMTPDYIEYQLHNSLNNLNLDTIDVFYLHNPESQFENQSHEEVYDQIERVFELLEALVEEGKIASYGIATWDGLRVVPDKNNYLKLESVYERAVQAGGEDHHFDVVQLPFNLGMSEALTRANQPVNEEPLTSLEACQRLDLSVVTSASIMQGKIVGNIPDDIRDYFDGFNNDVLRALQFTRSAPGVTTSLVGMSSSEHVEENLEIARYEPFDDEEFRDRFLEVVEEEPS